MVGDVNGQYTIPTFTINSYNEQEIDVTDYPYSFTDNPYEPKFFIGRWPIRTIPELLNIKSRSIQYVTNENLLLSNDDLEFYNNAMLVAGNYKTADGLEVPPNEWPVTPVWTSLWLEEELNNFGYTQIDTAFFHQYNYQTATYNPLIEDKWNEDTRFNNVMCGVMWDGLLEGRTPELGPALHLGKQSLIDEFSGLSVEGTIIDVFYHHVYSVIGDPSLPVTLKKPGNILLNIDVNDDNNADEVLTSSHVVTFVYDEFGNPIEDLVGVLFKNGEPFNNSEMPRRAFSLSSKE